MSLRRRSYEPGHSPKFLVVIDDTPECDRALYFASRRALRTGASVLMLRVIEMHDRNQQWHGRPWSAGLQPRQDGRNLSDPGRDRARSSQRRRPRLDVVIGRRNGSWW